MDGYFSTRRIEALTDGVFAIAMTLLVLDLKVTAFGNAATSGELLSHFMSNDSGFTSFVISFLLLGSMWAVHMRQFEYIKRADRHLTMINTLRLLVVVLIPLTTSMASTYQDLLIGRILFPINFLLLAIVSFWQWNYAVSKPEMYDKLSNEVKANARQRNLIILATSALVVLLSVFIGELAFLLFIVSPFAPRMFGRGKQLAT